MFVQKINNPYPLYVLVERPVNPSITTYVCHDALVHTAVDTSGRYRPLIRVRVCQEHFILTSYIACKAPSSNYVLKLTTVTKIKSLLDAQQLQCNIREKELFR